jgi:hypothetical protein
MITPGTDHTAEALPEAAGSLEALAAAVAQVRHALSGDGAAAVARLEGLAEGARHLLDVDETPAAWLTLLDELGLLLEDLERYRHALAGQVRTMARHRHAETAYHRTERRP